MSPCRKLVSEDSHAVARDKQRKWREALNIPDSKSGCQDPDKKPYVVSPANQIVSFLFIVWSYNLFCRDVSSGREHRTNRHNLHHRYVLICPIRFVFICLFLSSEENSDQSEQSDDETNSEHSTTRIPSPRKEDVRSRAQVRSPSKDKRTRSTKTRKEHSHSTARHPSPRREHKTPELSPKRDHLHSRAQIPSLRKQDSSPPSEPEELGGEVDSQSESEQSEAPPPERKRRFVYVINQSVCIHIFTPMSREQSL